LIGVHVGKLAKFGYSCIIYGEWLFCSFLFPYMKNVMWKYKKSKEEYEQKMIAFGDYEPKKEDLIEKKK